MLWHCALCCESGWEPSYSWDVFSKGGDREARANIIRQICEMFSALPLTFCAVPPITHSRQAQAGADLGNGLPQTHLSSSSSWCLGWGCWLINHAAELLWFGNFGLKPPKPASSSPFSWTYKHPSPRPCYLTARSETSRPTGIPELLSLLFLTTVDLVSSRIGRDFVQKMVSLICRHQ